MEESGKNLDNVHEISIKLYRIFLHKICIIITCMNCVDCILLCLLGKLPFMSNLSLSDRNMSFSVKHVQ